MTLFSASSHLQNNDETIRCTRFDVPIKEICVYVCRFLYIYSALIFCHEMFAWQLLRQFCPFVCPPVCLSVTFFIVQIQLNTSSNFFYRPLAHLLYVCITFLFFIFKFCGKSQPQCGSKYVSMQVCEYNKLVIFH